MPSVSMSKVLTSEFGNIVLTRMFQIILRFATVMYYLNLQPR